jgi:hypothetical protein
MRTVFPYKFYVPSLFALIANSFLCGFSQIPAARPSPDVGFVTGTVYCTDTNLPARDAQVVLDPWPSKESSGRHSMWAFTDLDGRFRSQGLAPGEYVVSADVDGYLQIGPRRLDDPWVRDSPESQREIESRFTKVTIVTNQTANTTLQIERGTEIRGTVLFDDGSPAIGLTITFGRKQSQPPSTDHPPSLFSAPIPDYFTHTDDDGRFRIRGVFPGLYQISVVVPTSSATEIPDDITRTFNESTGALRIYDDGSYQASRSPGLRVENGDREKDVKITIPLASLHTIRGEIVLKGIGSSPPAAAIQLLYTNTREIARVGVARDGNFQLNYVPEGTYILRAAASSLAEFPEMHQCPPDCPPLLQPAFGPFAEVPIVVAGEVSNLIVTVPLAPGATP